MLGLAMGIVDLVFAGLASIHERSAPPATPDLTLWSRTLTVAVAEQRPLRPLPSTSSVPPRP